MATRDEVHHLVDSVPEDQVAAIGEALRAALEAGLVGRQARRLADHLHDPISLPSQPVRTFASTGTMSAEPDLAERVEQILGTDA